MVHKPVPLSDVKPRILLILGAMVARFQQVHECVLSGNKTIQVPLLRPALGPTKCRLYS